MSGGGIATTAPKQKEKLEMLTQSLVRHLQMYLWE